MALGLGTTALNYKRERKKKGKKEKEGKRMMLMPMPMSVMQIREKDHVVYHLLSTEGGMKDEERQRIEDEEIMLEKQHFSLMKRPNVSANSFH